MPLGLRQLLGFLDVAPAFAGQLVNKNTVPGTAVLGMQETMLFFGGSFMKKSLTFVLGCFAASLMIGTATGATLSYGALAAPGTYFGTGNPNTGWTISTDTTNNLELGLGAFERFTAVTNQVNSVYYEPVGPTTQPGRTGSYWGFKFSVNTNVDGTGSAIVGDYNYNLSISDLTTSTNVSFDPTLLPDNSLSGTSGFQNAESLHFSFLATPLAYDMNAADTYRIILSATPRSGLYAENSVSIDVVTQTPEPGTSSMVVFGAGTAFVVLGLRRRRRQYLPQL